MLKYTLQFQGREAEACEGVSESPRPHLLSQTQLLAHGDTACNTEERSPGRRLQNKELEGCQRDGGWVCNAPTQMLPGEQVSSICFPCTVLLGEVYIGGK